MNKLLLYFSILFLSKSTFSQHKFIISEDFNHHNNSAYMVEESDEAYHVIGLTIETDTSWQSPFVLDLDKNGIYDKSKISIYRNDNFIMTMNTNNKTLKNDNEIIFHSSYRNELHVFSYDLLDSKISLRDSFFFESENIIYINDLLTFDNGYLFSGEKIANEPEGTSKSGLLLNTQTPDDTLSILTPNLWQTCERLLQISDSIFVSAVKVVSLIENRPFIKFLYFNSDLEYIKSIQSEDGNLDVHSVLNDEDGNFVFTSNEFYIIDTTSQHQFSYHTPYLVKLSDEGETLWSKSIGTHFQNQNRLSIYSNVIESKQNDGYVICGADFDSKGIRGSDAVLGKVSSKGDSLWYRSYTTLDPESLSLYNKFNDVIATEDGGYLAVGEQNYFDTIDNRNVLSMLIVKTDSLGLIAPDSTSTTVNITDIPEYTIFPNPTSNYLFVNMQSTEDWQLTLVDLHGKKVLERDLEKSGISYMLDLAHYPDGTYILHFNNSQSTFSEKIIINH